jgi:hypothetical protein
MNLKRVPVEIAGYRNARLATYNPNTKDVSLKWWSVRNDMYDEADFEPWNVEDGSDVPPF